MGWILWMILVHALICGGCCAFVASEKNRDVAAHAIGGFFLGIFWLIAIAGVPAVNKEVKEAQKQAGRREQPVVGEAATSSEDIPAALIAGIAMVVILFFLIVIIYS